MSPFEKLVATVADRTQLTRAQADKAVRETFVVVAELMQDGERVRVSDFGIFEAVEAPARTARNPKSGETISVSSRRRAKYRPSSVLQKSLNA